ncbi:hypothetical protein CONPUDRAFT_69784 [Coniophora puteana RWD-64-598 SS2]|uniref:Uncharacterized protein n=1 Tax=Coniophora puteana (strain RWD-64-598) TaxID=741705 RepID=A0A5M3N080_CONPW|nr:uncharacterized protein CONPUDRAFT_69784 [Coniophora puteana RWD-64-598 SS2]EIW84782.1 hypothetical protein CONPUDRAFT_69784 [Coniophora puteana RWD-64-598 SS2]
MTEISLKELEHALRSIQVSNVGVLVTAPYCEHCIVHSPRTVSGACFWLYYYSLNLHEEVLFLSQAPRSKLKLLYITTFGSTLLWIVVGFTSCVLLAICTETFFIIRTYALCERSKKVLISLLATLISIVIALILLFCISSPSFTPQNALGCYTEKESYLVAVAYSLLLALEIAIGLLEELVVFTATSAIWKHRQTKGLLALTLIQHNFFYFGFSQVWIQWNICLGVVDGQLEGNRQDGDNNWSNIRPALSSPVRRFPKG